LKDSVKIFGGFINTNALFSQRNWNTNVTILKGNGNSVILNNFALTNQAVLSGFTVTGATLLMVEAWKTRVLLKSSTVFFPAIMLLMEVLFITLLLGLFVIQYL
jgi:hypothetical protein